MKYRNTKYTIEEFTEKANKKHDDFYDYSKAIYENCMTKIIIGCPLHGDFEQAPVKHLSGQGWPKCAGDKRKKTFIKNYGVDNVQKVEEISNRSGETWSKRYGLNSWEGYEDWLNKFIKTKREEFKALKEYDNQEISTRKSFSEFIDV